MNTSPRIDPILLNLRGAVIEGNLGNADGNPTLTGERFYTKPARTPSVHEQPNLISFTHAHSHRLDTSQW